MSKIGKGKLVGWGVAIAAVAVLATAGTVYAAPYARTLTGPSAAPATQDAPLALSPAQLSSVLVPVSDQPNSTLYGEPATLKDTAATGGFADPAGMSFAPHSCTSYLEDALGSMSALDGVIQYGARNTTVDGTHPDYFVQQVINLPDGADLDKIRDAALTCSLGFITLSGGFTGAYTTKLQPAPTLSGATTLALVHTFQFRQPSNATEQAQLAEIGYACEIGSDTCTECPVETVFVASGNTLIISTDTNKAYADQFATTMLNNAKALN